MVYNSIDLKKKYISFFCLLCFHVACSLTGGLCASFSKNNPAISNFTSRNSKQKKVFPTVNFTELYYPCWKFQAQTQTLGLFHRYMIFSWSLIYLEKPRKLCMVSLWYLWIHIAIFNVIKLAISTSIQQSKTM